MSGAVFPPCSLAWGQTMVGVMATSSKRTYASMLHLPGLLRWPWPRPRGRPLSTCPFTTDSQTLTGKSGSVSWGDTVLSPRSWCAQGFVCALQVSSVLRKFCNQIPPAFKVRVPGCSQFLCWIPSLGNLLWSSSGICFFLRLLSPSLLPKKMTHEL